jgi:long-subunit fatty acid transport protein
MFINKNFTLAFLSLIMLVSFAKAQSTINSPYSKYGVGNLSGGFLPQNIALGNLAYGISSVGGYNNINVANPASYAQIGLTTFDVGARITNQNLSKNGVSEKSFNASLNHFLFAVPVNKKSALSFGLIPYSTLGYKFSNDAVVDTFDVEHVYSGEGGLSKAYLGYGISFGKHFSVGVNMSYLFGNLKETRATEFSKYVGFLNSKNEINNSVGGINFDFGAQYITSLNKKTKLTIGYTGGVKSNLSTSVTQLYSRYTKDYDTGTETRADSTYFLNDVAGNLVMPANHNFGFSIEKYNKWLIGADFRLAKWSQFSNNGVSQNLNNTFGFSVGGQITPNVNAVTSYYKLIDYRLGFNYDKTSVNINNKDIDVKSINFGFGLPLISGRSAFYKLNLTTEIGQRGTIESNLIKENFVNFSVGFTINDRWFQKYKYD